MTALKYKVAAITHTGKVRDHNEDNFILNPNLSEGAWVFDYKLEYSAGDDGAIWVVADGMGGTNAGEVASELAVQSVKTDFANTEKLAEGIKNPKKFLRKAILDMNDRILQHAEENPATQDMGTTVVLAWLLGDQLHVSWIGDSRAYLFRNGKLNSITKDHSLVQEMVDAGKLTDEQAFYHPENNIITQSLGGETKKLDPGYQNVELYSDDVVLLCTDGLNGMLLDRRIEELLKSPGDCNQRANQLLEAALAEGAHDNVTLVLARVTGGNELPAQLATTGSQTSGEQEIKTTTPDESERKTITPGQPKRGLVKKLLVVMGILLAFVLGMVVMYYGVIRNNDGEKIEEVDKDPSEEEEATDEQKEAEKNQEQGKGRRKGDPKQDSSGDDNETNVEDEARSQVDSATPVDAGGGDEISEGEKQGDASINRLKRNADDNGEASQNGKTEKQGKDVPEQESEGQEGSTDENATDANQNKNQENRVDDNVSTNGDGRDQESKGEKDVETESTDTVGEDNENNDTESDD